MENTVIYATVVYLLTYRLAILILGGMSIYLGYRLFVESFNQTNNSEAELSAKFGDATLTLKNAAPGIFFAIFGAAITIIILMGSPPEFIHSVVRDKNNGQVSKTLIGRGGKLHADTNLEMSSNNAIQLHRQIWDLHYVKIIELAKQVVNLEPSDPDYLDTLAAFYFTKGMFAEAVEQQSLAVESAKKSNVNLDGVAMLKKKLDVYREFLD